MKELENEVTMLDKFKCDQIIHFYGTLFIPNKICMIIEFAQFGSLQDLMNNQNETNVTMKLRTKMLIDAAKGIEYLHSNGILHRDIKPDNILVVSLGNILFQKRGNNFIWNIADSITNGKRGFKIIKELLNHLGNKI